jgi:hypothetical protein
MTRLLIPAFTEEGLLYHEPLISTAMLTEVPLTGLSFLTRSRRRGTTQQIGSGE